MRRITIEGNVGKMLLPILRGLSANTKTIHRTVHRWDTVPLDPSCAFMYRSDLQGISRDLGMSKKA